MRRLAFLAGAFSAVQMSLVAYLVTFLVQELRLDLVAAGAVLATAQLAGVGGRILWGAISGTLAGARWLLFMLGLVMTVASVMLAGFHPASPSWLLYAAAVLFGASAIGWNGVMLAELARIAPPGMAGVATGGSIFITFAGVTISPALFSGLPALGGGYKSGFLMLGMIALAGTVLAWRHKVA